MKSQIVNSKLKMKQGSALILTVVISVLLAVIAVLFILRTSVDSVGTMSVSDNKELACAFETVLAQLNRELVLDVPGVKTAAQPLGQEYHDYPGSNDLWLANLEPYQAAPDYVWGQVSDLYGSLGALRNNAAATLITDGTPIDKSKIGQQFADADGDGVADSRWVKAMAAPGTELRSGKGKQMYLALRVVDLGAMLNVNTGYLLGPTSDGSSVTQVNLFGVALRSTAGTNNIGQLETKWLGSKPGPFVLNNYETNVAERLDSPLGKYSPFGIAEELKLRYRYILNFNAATTRMDNNDKLFWADAWEGGISTPSSSLTDWQPRVNRRDLVPAETGDPNDPNGYDYRHITTTFNCDRLIDPNGDPMTNINDPAATAQLIYDGLRTAMPAVDPNILAQLAVNIKDYRDADYQVTAFKPNPTDPNGDLFNLTFYGHSSPFMWISELAFSQQTIAPAPPSRSYAIELYIPQTTPPTDLTWRLLVDGAPYALPSSGTWAGQFLVLLNDPDGLLTLADPNAAPGGSAIIFNAGSVIELQRQASDGLHFTVDHMTVPAGWPPAADDPAKCIRRDMTDINVRCIRKVWDLTPGPTLTLGADNGYDSGGGAIQYFTKDADYTTIGELGNVLIKATNDIGPMDTEATARLDWTAVPFADITRYFTAMKAPAAAGDRIYGRININTAPYFVLAQLPWMQYDFPMASTDPNRFSRARDVVARREAVNGFKSIADVIHAPLMQNLAVPPDGPLVGAPDFSGDDVDDDFEERDIIFSRISNLATVRSDVFCAYILVRLGEDGPQKRVMVILDRSDVKSPADKVKVRAFHPVPDPR